MDNPEVAPRSALASWSLLIDLLSAIPATEPTRSVSLNLWDTPADEVEAIVAAFRLRGSITKVTRDHKGATGIHDVYEVEAGQVRVCIWTNRRPVDPVAERHEKRVELIGGSR